MNLPITEGHLGSDGRYLYQPHLYPASKYLSLPSESIALVYIPHHQQQGPYPEYVVPLPHPRPPLL